jgi:hypothetical protein
LASFALIGGFILFRCNKSAKKEEFIRTDCQFYEPGKVVIEEYFGRRNDFFIKGISRPEKPITEDTKNKEREDINTTRELKEDEHPTENNIERGESRKETHKLKEVNELEDINMDNKLVIKENKPAPSNDIILRDNFVDNNSKKTSSTTLTPKEEKLNIITIKDYLALEFKYVPTYDLRTAMVYIKDEVNNKHRLLSVLQKHSIMDPVIIRSTKLMFYLSSSLASSALLFTDGYIEDRINIKVNYF